MKKQKFEKSLVPKKGKKIAETGSPTDPCYFILYLDRIKPAQSNLYNFLEFEDNESLKLHN